MSKSTTLSSLPNVLDNLTAKQELNNQETAAEEFVEEALGNLENAFVRVYGKPAIPVKADLGARLVFPVKDQ